RSQRLDLELEMTVDFLLRHAFLLHLLQPVAVPQQLEVLPRRKQQHCDQQTADADRPPELTLPVPVDLADDWVVADVLFDRVFKGVGSNAVASGLYAVACRHASRSAARNLALRARGFLSISASDGITGLFVSTRMAPSPLACIPRS